LDQELRRLELAHRASRSPEDGERWLVARVRAGKLWLPRLEVAALAGDEASRRALVGIRGRWLVDGATFERLLGANRMRVQELRRIGCPTVRIGRWKKHDIFELTDWLSSHMDFPVRADGMRTTLAAIHERIPLGCLRLLLAVSITEADRRGFHAKIREWLDAPRFDPASRRTFFAPLDGSPPSDPSTLIPLVHEYAYFDPVIAFHESLWRLSRPGPKWAAGLHDVLVPWALADRDELSGAERFEVVVRGRPGPGDYVPPESFLEHQVVDWRSGKVVLEFEEDVINGPISDAATGAANVEISPDGRHAIVRDHNGSVERIPIPSS
jgi:hypothetical protein